jgi:CRP/FNR family transcriptional regulator
MTVEKILGVGDYLFHQGSPVHGFYVVRRGAIKVHRLNSLGKEQVLHIFRPVESFGEESLVASTGHSACACATEPSSVLLVARPPFLDLLHRHPDLTMGLLRSFYRHVQILVGLLDDLTLKDVKTRLANWLIQRCPNPASHRPVCIRLPSTKRVLAAELGTVSETLSRTVAKLRDQHLLTTDGDTVTLCCPRRLTELFQPGFFALPAVADPAFWSGHPG